MKKNNKVIVAVSGYFDPLHVGHIEYFVKAKELGDFLYVIVNNDFQANLKKNKYFMNEKDRFEIIQSLRIVDKTFLSIDKDKSVSKTLEMINPDIFGNGGDQIKGSILEEPTCVKNNIQIVDCLGEKIRSSSKITGIKSN
tara:strand:- start:41 stop:460 length:420 start_codon:yes stop_codon:yes gene_type:complete